MWKQVAWTPLLLLCAAFATGVSASDLRKLFYSRIRDLLNTPQFTQETSPKPTEVKNWGTNLEGKLGQVSGVSVNNYGQPVIFHRGPRSWDSSSQLFNNSHYYIGKEDGPINVDTIVTLDPLDGKIVQSWGKDLFYLPHGITIDHHDNTWVTDIAMHQVLKFSYGNHKRPTLSLGESFTPGSSETRFCKPTSVAIALNGHIFVADGYCNDRIMKFNHEGVLIRIFPQNGEFLSLLIPHGITLMHHLDLLCVADRENMRVACFNAELCPNSPPRPSSPFTIHQPDLGRVFGIASNGNLAYAVNGPTSSHIPIQGFTIDPTAELIVDHWMPSSAEFTNPHDIAISPYGDALYVVEIGPNKVWKFNIDGGSAGKRVYRTSFC
ncbi:hypothetical protein GE061_001735 [Apolygus lucorum]|uniref:peptidylamidoglycolate lyase n=1 Tax=Apolygus lucorum TaxID=248454 RepID=A0A8S9Y7Y9_APOLU|nr:hypothetical protein GE061_001735 [Apolygus lucorum]